MSSDRLDRGRELVALECYANDLALRRGAVLTRYAALLATEAERVSAGHALNAAEERARLFRDLAALDDEQRHFDRALVHTAVAHAFDVGAKRARLLVAAEP